MLLSAWIFTGNALLVVLLVVFSAKMGARSATKRWKAQVEALEFLIADDSEKAFVHALMSDPDLLTMGDTYWYDGGYRRDWIISKNGLSVHDKNPALCYKQWLAMSQARKEVKALYEA